MISNHNYWQKSFIHNSHLQIAEEKIKNFKTDLEDAKCKNIELICKINIHLIFSAIEYMINNLINKKQKM